MQSRSSRAPAWVASSRAVSGRQGVQGEAGWRPGRIPAPGRPLVSVRERSRAVFKHVQRLGPGEFHRLMLGVGNDPEAPDVGVLVLVLPPQPAQVRVDDEVHGQVECAAVPPLGWTAYLEAPSSFTVKLPK